LNHFVIAVAVCNTTSASKYITNFCFYIILNTKGITHLEMNFRNSSKYLLKTHSFIPFGWLLHLETLLLVWYVSVSVCN